MAKQDQSELEQRIAMIKVLSEAAGVPGFEQEVRQIYAEYLKPLADSVERDRFGGIVGKKIGDAEGPKVLIAGHLDEVGMMVIQITDEGFIKFQTLGGWWSHVMLAQRVVIQTRKGPVQGVIGSKPPHMLSQEERGKTVKNTDLYIDIGALGKAEAEASGVRPGDPIVPLSTFTRLVNEKVFMGKALDNRLGCAAAVEVLRALQGEAHPNILYAGATTQEEVGSRGAQTLANLLQPDIAIALDTGIAGGTPGIAAHEALSQMGNGPVLIIFDAATIPNRRLRDFVMDTAAELNIPLQVDIITGGFTDAGRFQLTGSGVPAITFGFAVRYLHTHASLYHQDDFDQGVTLLAELVKRLDWPLVRDICEY